MVYISQSEGRFRSWVVDAGAISAIEECWSCIILDNIGNSGLARSGGTIPRTCSRLVVADIGNQPNDGALYREKRRRGARLSGCACSSLVMSVRCIRHTCAISALPWLRHHRCDDSTKVSSIKSRCERPILDEVTTREMRNGKAKISRSYENELKRERFVWSRFRLAHSHSQQPVPRGFPLFKRCEWLVIDRNVIKRTSLVGDHKWSA